MKKEINTISYVLIFLIVINLHILQYQKIETFNALSLANSCQQKNQSNIKSSLDFIEGWTQNPGKISDLAFKDTILYLAGGDKELFIVNISDVYNPKIISSFHSGFKSRLLEYTDNYVYIVTENNTIDIIDVQNKSFPTLVGQYSFNETITDLCFSKNNLILGKGSYGIEILDVSNFMDITVLCNFSDSGTAEKIGILDDFLVIGNGFKGLTIYNISDTSTPKLISSYNDGNYSKDFSLANEVVLVIDNSNSLKILNISDISSITKITEYEIGSIEEISLFEGQTLASTKDEIINLNCTDFTNISELWRYETNSAIKSFSLSGNQIVIAEIYGNEILEIALDKEPILLKRFGYEEIKELYIYDNTLIGVFGEEGISILDITQPASIQFVSTFSCNGKIVDIDKVGDRIYCAIQNQGVKIVDISDIQNPYLIGEFNSSGEANQICSYENYVFLADGYDGFKVFNIGNISNPSLINTDDTNYISKISIFDDAIFVIEENSGLAQYPLSEAISPNSIYFNGKMLVSGVGYNDVAMCDNALYTCIDQVLYSYRYNDSGELNLEHSMIDGVFYDLALENNRLYASGGRELQIIELDTLNRIDFTINDTVLIDIAVKNGYIFLANAWIGDDILIYSFPINDNSRIWMKIFIPIGAIGGLTTGLIIFVVLRNKRKGTEPY